ncbi:phage tail sheath subtilisin-like domain-containing protein [Pseudarthrobacter sp. J75]|uniref:phage tail sheath family protein n=1 Tax=unclassified Pseudarthrobacter TaxID=2647000 RepID=UPI002E81C422|nr:MULTISPECIES: phage tail sheath subtilisin-like domain-containing protein [unclassified Pseudarthrobacter]MEE2524083.1 phage tail sheath subtilisin-like domain-containing protein [Pseudarthrobacter sp. J47]MEE2530362.1 phage tail sheath subtilisin-like domain-containing protein [Pseudarthrobacter sp. J75]
MANYLAPGVYVQEIPSGARPIGQVSTSIAAFVGVAPDDSAFRHEAVVLDNWSQFVDRFVGKAGVGSPLSNAVYGFFANGGGRCYVVNVGKDGSLTGTAAKPSGLSLLEAIDDISMVAAPGFSGAEAYAALQEHVEHPLRQDRMAILDTAETVDDVGTLTRASTSGVPDEDGGGSPDADEGSETEETPDAGTSEGDPPKPAAAPPNPATAPSSGRRSGRDDAAGAPQSPGGYTALYYPWIVMIDPVSGKKVTQPPSGHIAGVWARVDATRGVHKAPANEPIQGALDLVRRVSRGEQEVLNPAGVNCIRYFPGEGIRIWGARTKAPEASEYRYINVRRLTNMIKESVAEGTRWVVFEPNDHTLWKSIRRDVGAFLTNVWRDGALLGTTPQQAFYVKCDEENNPASVRDAGQVITEIGIAPVKPAEFVIFKLMQSADTTEIETAGA